MDIPDGGDSSTLGSGAGVCDTSTKGEKSEIETESQEIVKEKILIPGYKVMMPRNLSAGEIGRDVKAKILSQVQGSSEN